MNEYEFTNTAVAVVVGINFSLIVTVYFSIAIGISYIFFPLTQVMPLCDRVVTEKLVD